MERPLDGDEQRLLASIPADVSDDCLPLDRAEPIQGELAALVCDTEDVEALYELFPTQDTMNAAFEINVNSKQAPAGDCATEHLAVEPYTIDGDRAGRVLCYTITRESLLPDPTDNPEESRIEWTDENALIYAQAVRNDLSDLSLYEWWLASGGPVPPGADAAPPKDPSRGLASALLQDGSYLVTPAKACAEFKGATCALHIDGTSYRDAIVGEELPPAQIWSGAGWVIDPIDGTTNFAHGLPFYGTSIGYLEGGVPRLGWISDPVRGEIYEAVAGRGATVEGIPLRLAELPPSPLLALSVEGLRTAPLMVKPFDSAAVIAAARALCGMENVR